MRSYHMNSVSGAELVVCSQERVLSSTYELLLEQASRLRREQAAGLLAYALPSYSEIGDGEAEITDDVDMQHWANLWIGDDDNYLANT